MNEFDPDSKRIHFRGGKPVTNIRPFKECITCKHLKTVDSFPFHNNRNVSRRNQCRKCINEIAKRILDKRREEVRNYLRDYAKRNIGKPKQRAHSLYHNARTRAINAGLEFNLSKQFIQIALEKGVCEQTGITFDMTPGAGTASGRRWFAPSIDRIDPSKGYTDENTQVVVWCYNAGKGEMSDEEFLQFARHFVEYQNCVNQQ